MKVNILGVQVDKISQDEAVKMILKWLKGSGRYYVVTPNVEMVVKAQDDREFRKIINQADLAIPDSARFGWAYQQLNTKNRLEKFLTWPLFLFSKAYPDFPVTTGADLVNELIKESAEKGFVVGFLGGNEKVAIKLVERLKRRYPKLKIGLVESGLDVNSDGEDISKSYKLDEVEMRIDILFVALGHGKQEKWMARNINKYNTKVMIGVGGALDYLSGLVPRAPIFMRELGFEWLFRIVVQPWRAKRFLALFKFIFLVF